MKTSIIIPCYCITDELVVMARECIDSLYKTQKPDEVIIVDDGSTKQGVVKSDIFMRQKINRGYPRAVNMGLAVSTGDIIIIANNDITFTKGWLDAILLPITELGYDISSIRTSDNDDTTEDEITENDKFGSIWAMRREVYERVGGMDERFGTGTFEDTDFRRRALEAGFKIAKNHSAMVMHEGRATFDIVDSNDTLFEKNKKIYEEKWGDDKH